MGKKAEPAPKPEEPSPTPVAAPAPAEKKAEEPTPETGDRGRKKDWPTTRAGQQERSVSPGTLPGKIPTLQVHILAGFRRADNGIATDGTHATTHGDKGEGYQPKGKLGRMAGKVFGAH
jgi:hypothetical protein